MGLFYGELFQIAISCLLGWFFYQSIIEYKEEDKYDTTELIQREKKRNKATRKIS